ncbi:hypothetical protein Tco_0243916, partial [Tanacetum coccineum]
MSFTLTVVAFNNPYLSTCIVSPRTSSITLIPGPQRMTSGQISSGLDLTYAPSTITTPKPTEGDLDLLFEAMYDDYIGGQPSSAPADSTPTPIIASSQATVLSNTSQDVDELEIQE